MINAAGRVASGGSAELKAYHEALVAAKLLQPGCTPDAPKRDRAIDELVRDHLVGNKWTFPGSCADPVRAPLATAVLLEEQEAGMIAPARGEVAASECLGWHALVQKHMPCSAAGKCRIIHDYSLPSGRSLNDAIKYVKLSYEGIDRASAAPTRDRSNVPSRHDRRLAP